LPREAGFQKPKKDMAFHHILKNISREGCHYQKKKREKHNVYYRIKRSRGIPAKEGGGNTFPFRFEWAQGEASPSKGSPIA